MKRPNWYGQLGLAAGLFALASAAYWLEYKHKPQKESTEEQSKKVFQVKDTPIRSIAIQTSKKRIQLDCADFEMKLCKPGDQSKWEVVLPIKVKADDSNANNLVSTLNNLVSNEVISLKDESPEKKASLLKDYGLDAGSRATAPRLEVTTATGKTQVVLGQTHPIGDTLFALSENDENTVYLLPAYFKANFDRELTYWRDKKILTLGAHEVVGFTLKGSKEQILANRTEGQWILKSSQNGEEYAGDLENIDNLLTAATYLSAKEFPSNQKSSPEAKALLKGFSPAVELVLRKEKGEAKEAPAPIALQLFQKKGLQKLYATVSSLDPLFELDASAKDRIDKSLKDLRLTKLITSMDRFQAKRIELSGASLGSSPIVLTSKDEKWKMEGSSEALPDEKITDLLEQLSGNRIQEFVKGGAIPSGEKEGLRISLGDEKDPKKRELVLWKNKDKLYARDLKSKRNEAFLVDSTISGSLPWNRDFFKKTEKTEEKKASHGLSPSRSTA